MSLLRGKKSHHGRKEVRGRNQLEGVPTGQRRAAGARTRDRSDQYIPNRVNAGLIIMQNPKVSSKPQWPALEVAQVTPTWEDTGKQGALIPGPQRRGCRATPLHQKGQLSPRGRWGCRFWASEAAPEIHQYAQDPNNSAFPGDGVWGPLRSLHSASHGAPGVPVLPSVAPHAQVLPAAPAPSFIHRLVPQVISCTSVSEPASRRRTTPRIAVNKHRRRTDSA